MPEWVMILLGQAFTAGAIYGAIKADITAASVKADGAQKSADGAHTRIDNIYERRTR